jgi:hypothetical protein
MQWSGKAAKTFRTNIVPFTITSIFFYLGYIDRRDRLMIGERFWEDPEPRRKSREQVRILKQKLELINKEVEIIKDRSITAPFRGR